MLRSLKLSVTLPSSKLRGSPTFTLLGGSDSTFGNRKRALPSVQAAMVPTKATQAIANGEVSQRTRKLRRSSPFFGGAVAGLAGIGGLAGAGVAVAVGAAAGGWSGIAWEPSSAGKRA